MLINLKLEQRGHTVMCPNDRDKMANGEDPDQTLILVCTVS